MVANNVETDYTSLYEAQQSFLWGYCYRLTGSAADAEDVVQETFVRALERPPADTTLPWRPWLVRVATNLVRDAARKQKRRDYIGPWLPSPMVTEDVAAANRGGDVAGRYEMMESVSVAFLLALEVLTASQRAVLLLRDVYGDTAQETADTLEMTVANVKTTLHRARQALAQYDADQNDVKRLPSGEQVRRTREVLERLLSALAGRDVGQIEALLTEKVTALADGGGQFYAARVPVLGRQKVALLFSRIAPEANEKIDLEFCLLNGRPAVVVERPEAPDGFSRFFTLAIDVDAEGMITHTYTTLAPDKLTDVNRWAARRSSRQPSETVN